MPVTVTLYDTLVWFALGFALALGWTLGAWLMSRVLAAIFH